MRNQKYKHPNAFKHGVFAETAILPGEDRQEFEELHAHSLEEWKPDGPTEEDAVLSIAKAFWNKRRLQKYLDVQFFKNSRNPSHPAYDKDEAKMDLAMAMQTDPERNFKRCSYLLDASTFQDLRDRFPRTNFKTTEEWAGAVVNDLTAGYRAGARNMAPALARTTANMHAFLTSFENLSEDILERVLALDERLDATIDRAVKRLIQLKAMKPMLNLTSSETAGDRPRKIVSSRQEHK